MTTILQIALLLQLVRSLVEGIQLQSMQDFPGTEISVIPAANFTNPSTAFTFSDFYQHFVRRNIPVIFRQGMHGSPALSAWTDAYIIENSGNVNIRAEVSKSEVRGGPVEEMQLRDFIKAIDRRPDELYAIVGMEEGSEDSGASPEALLKKGAKLTNRRVTNDGADVADLCEADRSKLAEKLRGSASYLSKDVLIPSMLRCREILYQSLTMWFSSGGTSSVLHQDDADNLLMAVKGTKDVVLIEQKYADDLYAAQANVPGTSAVHQDRVALAKYPKFAAIPKLKGRLEEGDILFIPHSYWHQVKSHGQRNIAVNVWWGMEHDYRWWKDGMQADAFSKAREKLSPKEAKCTEISEGARFSDVNFLDEGVFKDYLGLKRQAAQQKAKKRNRKKKSEL